MLHLADAHELTRSAENDTLARIGTSCLQQLLESNVKKLSPARWERVATTFVKLFRTTTPHQLFDESLRVEIDGNGADLQDAAGLFYLRRSLKQIIDCVSSDSNDGAMITDHWSPTSASPKDLDRPARNESRRFFCQIIVKGVLQLLLI